MNAKAHKRANMTEVIFEGGRALVARRTVRAQMVKMALYRALGGDDRVFNEDPENEWRWAFAAFCADLVEVEGLDGWQPPAHNAPPEEIRAAYHAWLALSGAAADAVDAISLAIFRLNRPPGREELLPPAGSEGDDDPNAGSAG